MNTLKDLVEIISTVMLRKRPRIIETEWPDLSTFDLSIKTESQKTWESLPKKRRTELKINWVKNRERRYGGGPRLYMTSDDDESNPETSLYLYSKVPKPPTDMEKIKKIITKYESQLTTLKLILADLKSSSSLKTIIQHITNNTHNVTLLSDVLMEIEMLQFSR